MKENFTIRIDTEIRTALEKKAKKDDRSLGYIINNYIIAGLEKDKYLKANDK